MYDVELAQEILRQILRAGRTIDRRFVPIASPEDFVGSEAGLEKLDSVLGDPLQAGGLLRPCWRRLGPIFHRGGRREG